MMNIQEVKNQIGLEVENSEEVIKKYSRDASIFEVRPEAVLFPKNTSEVQNLVKWVSEKKQFEKKLSLTARSAGTDMSGGPLSESLVVDFTKYFNKIGKIETEESISEVRGESLKTQGMVVVDPGVYYRDFEKATLEKNLLLPCYTASKLLNTVGGMAGNNSAGEKTLAYGQTKDWVEELEVVLSDGSTAIIKSLTEGELEKKIKLANLEGKIYREVFHLVKENRVLIEKCKPTTSKNSAGYYLWEVWDENKRRFNLQKLIVGSQGTLAFVTKIKYRLITPRPKNRMVAIFLNDLSILGKLVTKVLEFKPETLESYDDHTFSLAMRFLPEMIKKMSRDAGSAFGGLVKLFKLGVQFLPEVLLTLTGGVPKLVVIAEFTGFSDQEVLEQVKKCEAAVKSEFKVKTHITASAEESEKYWTIRRESFSLLRQHSSGLSTAPFVDDIVVHPLDLPEFLPRLNAIFKKYPSLVYTIAGHAGDANFHIIPLMDLTKKDQRDIIPKLSEEVYSLVVEYKGSITAEHNDGIVRTPFLRQQFGEEMVGLFEKVKNIFDPKNIFNPGKKVGGSWAWAMEHIKRN
ncbi:MAG: FAD-binding oxidoreductase [Candidatus Doudnabacteria bacterium]|nr:FAD-binding oxidoreductase [Candidatus Doudnabacteria bacterium]